MKKRLWTFSVFTFFLTFALMLLLLELGLRRMGYQHQPTWNEMEALCRQEEAARAMKKGKSLYQPNPSLGWQLSPNGTSVVTNDFNEQKLVSINAQGMYDRPPKVGAKYVFIMGDSFVEGYQVPLEKHFTRLLEHDFPGYDFLNFGVSGFSTVQAYVHTLERMKTWTPTRVILAIYYGNDFLENDPSRNLSMLGVPHQDRSRIPFWIDHQLRYGVDLQKIGRFKRRLLNLQVFLLGREHLERFRQPYGAQVAEELILSLKRILTERRVSLSVLLIPDDALWAPLSPRFGSYKKMEKFLRAHQIHTISLYEPFKHTGKKTMGHTNADGETVDPHWTASTHRLVADTIRQALPF